MSSSSSSPQPIQPRSIFIHKGPYDAHSRLSPALRFLEHYTTRIDSASYNCSYLPYYHPQATFHDTTGVDYHGGQVIWDWIVGLFEPFERIWMETVETLVLEQGGEGEGKDDSESAGEVRYLIYGEWWAHFWPKGRGEVGKVSVKRSMVFEIGRAERYGNEKAIGGEEEVGFEGLQIKDVRLYYDRSLLIGLLRKSKQEIEKFGESAGRN